MGASRVEEVIATLAATVQRQQAEIDALRDELRARPTAEDVAGLRDAAMAGLSSLEGRVSSAEADLNVRGLGHPDVAGGSATAGEAVAWLVGQGERIERRLSEAATAAQLDAQAASLRAELAVAIDSLEGSKASKRAVAA